MSALNKIYSALLERADDEVLEVCLDEVLGNSLGFVAARSFYLALTEFDDKHLYQSQGKFYIRIILT